MTIKSCVDQNERVPATAPGDASELSAFEANRVASWRGEVDEWFDSPGQSYYEEDHYDDEDDDEDDEEDLDDDDFDDD